LKTRPLNHLYQSSGGLMSYPISLPTNYGEPDYPIYSASLGDLNNVSLFNGRNFGRPIELTGAGGDVKEELAQIKATAETLERYCSCVYKEDQFILATANELGEEALDLDSIPRISDIEAAHPSCFISKPDKDKVIRWVKGYSLTNKKTIWVPAVMTYLHIPQHENERFWLPISTGCAIHRSYEEALINGINEVVERDAIALTWLHRFKLPKLKINEAKLPAWVQEYYQQIKEQDFIETEFFDATTDLGVPSIYCVQTARHNSKVSTIVMCTTELDPDIALTKIIREAASLRIALQNKAQSDRDIDEFIDVMDGALYMGKPERMDRFNFLKHSDTHTKFEEMPNYSTGQTKSDLDFLITRLGDKGHELIAVDLTTDESKRHGMYAVKVISPTLMPLSFAYRARFLGTERLYSAPQKMGYGNRTEEDINKDPQPFA
jgi:ribosomal protein S12 methylthiotransferase accessory factor